MATRDHTEQNDAQLVAACRAGDAEAWQALVHRYQRLVYSIPRKAGLDDEACADVFQQVFTRLVEHLPRLEQPDRLGPWLVITAKREAWRVSRKTLVTAPASESDEEDGDPLERLPANDPLPDEILAELQE